MTQILGPDGRPLDLAAVMGDVREPQTASVGWLHREFDAHPARGLTPASLAAIMLASEQGNLVGQLDLTDDMEERDAHLYAELGKRRGAVTALAWSIEEPEKATPEEERLTEQVRDWVGMVAATSLAGTTGGFELVLQCMASAVLPGFAPLELVWDYLPDAAGRKVLVPRATEQPRRWFTTSADRRRFLLRSRDAMTEGTADLPPVMGEELKPYAWLMHTHPARNGYLARMSLARVLFWPYLFKNYSIRDLAEFLEIYGLPLRIGKYPTGASDDERRALLRAVQQIGHNAAGIIPQGMALEFQAAAAGTEVPFAAMWDRMDAAESKAILGQTLTASEGQHGTQALGQVHNEVRMDIRDADARAIERTIDQQLIRPLCLLNIPGVNPRRLPRFQLDTGEPEDLALYAQHLPTLAKNGMRIGVKWAHDKLRIPQAEDGEQVLAEPPPPAPATGAPGGPPGAAPAPGQRPPAADAAAREQARAALTAALATAIAAQAAPRPDLVDELVAEQVAQWRPLLAPMVEPLLAEIDKAIAAGESLTAFAERLPELVRLMDAAAITDDLARAAFSARLAGEADLDLGTEN